MATTTPGRVLNALVSFWRAENSTADRDFLGNGVFVAPGWVLTAAHLWSDENWQQLWVRPHAAGTRARAPSSAPLVHPKLDLALVQLQGPADPAQFLLLAETDLDAEGLVYTFYRQGGESPGTDYALQVMGGKRDGLCIVKSRFTAGESGSAVRTGDRLAGIVIACSDDNDRGYFAPVTAFRDWLMDELKLPASPQPVSNTLRERFARCFNHSAFIGAGIIANQGELPAELSAALQTNDALRGERCVEALMSLPGEFIKVDRARVPTLAGAKERLKEAMGLAALQCVKPRNKEAKALVDHVITIGAQFEATGMLALLQEAGHQHLAYAELDTAEPGVVARNVRHISMAEAGPIDNARARMLELVHEWLYKPDATARQKFAQLSLDDQTKRLKLQLGSLKSKKDARYARVEPSFSQHFGKDLLNWLCNGLGLPAFALTGSDDHVFFVEEDWLFHQLAFFLSEFEHDVWKR